MNAEILTIGAEILAGDVLDTNGRDLARSLADLGITVGRRVSVPDEIEVIAGAIREALGRADVVLTTGGLGPTPDDLTREGIARALGVACVLRNDLVEPLRERFRSFGYPDMPDTNLGQLTLPEGAEPIPNPIGTAPGFRIEHEGRVLFSVPGIPREMQVMLEESILPWLRANRTLGHVAVRLLRTIGIGESELVARHGDLFGSLSGIQVGFYPQLPGVDLKLSLKSADARAAASVLAGAEARIRAALGTHVWGVDRETLPGVVEDLLVARGWKVGTAESCTGGRIAAAFTSVSGSSRTFDRSVVVYADRAKVDLLGVPASMIVSEGAVSEAVVRAMAEGLRLRSGVEVALAVTGTAGPGGGTPEKPVGTVWSAIAWPLGDTRTWPSRFAGSREMIMTRTVNMVLNRLRLLLMGAGGDG